MIEEKSKGHVCFRDGYEWFLLDSGELYRAPADRPIMPNGRRCGRWEYPAHMAQEKIKDLLATLDFSSKGG